MKFFPYSFNKLSKFNCPPRFGLVNNFCQLSIFNVSTAYAAILGLLGVFLSFYDVYQVIKCGATLPCSIWRARIKSGCIVTPEVERDLKLISLILSLEYYLMLAIGALMSNAIFFIPWMIFYSVIIALEFLLFLSRVYNGGAPLEKHSLILSIFVIYNWLAICCSFYHLTGTCH